MYDYDLDTDEIFRRALEVYEWKWSSQWGWKDICTQQVVQYTQTDTIRERQFANRSTGSRFAVNRKSDKPSLIRWKRIPEVNLQDT